MNDLEVKLQELREEYKLATVSDRKIIPRRGRALQIAIEKHNKTGKIGS